MWPSIFFFLFFFFNDTATTEIYTLSLHDALPISASRDNAHARRGTPQGARYREGRSLSEDGDREGTRGFRCGDVGRFQHARGHRGDLRLRTHGEQGYRNGRGTGAPRRARPGVSAIRRGVGPPT